MSSADRSFGWKVDDWAAARAQHGAVERQGESSSLKGLTLGAAVMFGAAVVLGAALIAEPVFAGEAQILRVASRGAALEGELEGVSVGPLGELESAPRVEKLNAFDEPFVFCAAASKHGWILGTGNEGKVLSVNPEGGSRVVGQVPEPEVFAVHSLSDGSIVAAGSPSGKVYRLSGGESELLFDPGATYVWALAEDSQGRILAATGLPGRLVRWDRSSKKPSLDVLYESPDAHVRSMMLRDDGSVYVGTAGQGLIVRLDAEGRVQTLYDADAPEVLAFADDGEHVYAALLASEASFVDLSPGAKDEGEEGNESPTPTIGSRAGDHEGPRSLVLSIASDGSVDQVAQLEDETIHAMAVYGSEGRGGGLWIGTGQEGRLYRLQDDELIREAELAERQLVAMAPGPAKGSKEGLGNGVLGVVTTNSAAIYRIDGSRHAEGVYSSKIHDLGQPAELGVFRWRGDQPSDSSVKASFRTGMSSTPDATWTDWTEGKTVKAKSELSLAGQSGRFLQWRLELRGSGQVGPKIQGTELSYRQRNRAPEILAFKAQDPGQILVPQSYNPTSTTFEPWAPNRDGIFTSVRKERESSTLKTLWKKGYRTLKWEAEDGNSDPLTYDLEVRREGDTGAWLTMVEDLDETWFSFDSTVLPDGIYRFRLTATDQAENSDGRALSSQEVSEPTTVDHTGPAVLSQKRARDGNLEVRVRDANSPLRSAVWSIDAGSWQSARPVDGLLDSRDEGLILDLPTEAGAWVLLRLTDAAFNVVTLDLSNE